MKLFSSLAIIALFGSFVSCNKMNNKDQQTAAEPKAVVLMDNSPDAPLHLSKAEFLSQVFDFEKNSEWNYLGDVPCIIDFYADWCRPCRLVSPIMEELAKEYKGKIIIYKVDTDKERELAGAFNISSIPAVLFVPMTGQPQMSVGAMSKEDYVKVVNEFLVPTVKNNK